MFVLNVSGNTLKKKEKWHDKLYKYLLLASVAFVTVSLYCVVLINTVSDTSATHHNHQQDVIVIVNNYKPKGIIENEYGNKTSFNHLSVDDGEANEIKEKEKVRLTDVINIKPNESNIPVNDPEIIDYIEPNVKINEAQDGDLLQSNETKESLSQDPNNELAVLSAAWGTPPNELFEADAYKYRLPGENSSEPIPHNTLIRRMMSIRESMRVCWGRYKECGWGSDNLHPDTCKGSTWFGLGLTIIDSLDTLFIMRLNEELVEATNFAFAIDYKKGMNNVNIFEITIRVLGAFLTMFSLTKQQFYLDKAVELGDLMIDSGAFNTDSGVPLSDIDLSTGVAHRPTCKGCSKHSSLSEVTTIQLEFNELTRLTGNGKYKIASDKAMNTILRHLPQDGLPRIYVDVKTGVTEGTITLGARGDSYYEYLLKQWIQTGNTRFEEAYLRAVTSINNKLVFSSYRNLTYIAEILASGKLKHKMDHLVCFLPGTLALGTLYGAPHWHLVLAESVIRTCVEMYRTASQLAPEIVHFGKTSRKITITNNDAFSLLRPETVESLFVLWRVTHDVKYRVWSWDIYSGIERAARVDKLGYSSMDKINTARPLRKDSLESFFLAETLKYLYLIHLPDDVLPLTRYVFNTEAHPFPVPGRGELGDADSGT